MKERKRAIRSGRGMAMRAHGWWVGMGMRKLTYATVREAFSLRSSKVGWRPWVFSTVLSDASCQSGNHSWPG